MAEDLAKELERMRARAERERKARVEAELVAEAGTRQIYERQRQIELLQVITDAANSSETPESCLLVTLQEWCRFTAWPVGHVYLVQEGPRRLVSSRIWNIDQPLAFAAFREATERTEMQPGEGLPGRVLESNKSVWVTDALTDKNFVRVQACPALNLHSAFGFPVRIGDEVAAVIEFYSTQIEEPNEIWLQLATQVGTQIGRVFERVRARQALMEVNARLQREVVERQRAEEAIKSLQPRLIEASRQAGRAEVATGVLHNVGNVLNSVNVSVTGVREHLQKSRIPLVGKSARLIEENLDRIGEFLTKDVKGKSVPGFLARLGESLDQENQWLRAEIDSLSRHIDHIKKIVTMQQGFGRMSGITETVEPFEIVEDALHLSAEALERHGIEVIREFNLQQAITADRHKTLQILINLLRNSIQSIEEANPARRVLTVRINEQPGGERIAISVSDTGMGIEPENMKKIFQHGFTTKKDGHGFGLHSAALAAREMKGELGVQSDGPGRGATFTLELPKRVG